MSVELLESGVILFLTEACLFEVSCQNQIEAIRVGVVQLLLLYKDGDYGLESCSVAYL